MKTNFAFKSPEGKAAVLKAYDKLLEHWTLPNDKFAVDTRYGSTFIIATGANNAQPHAVIKKKQIKNHTMPIKFFEKLFTTAKLVDVK